MIDRTRMVSVWPGNSRSQAAKAANDEVNGQAFTRGRYQRCADLRILELVHFRHNARGPAGVVMFDLAANQREKTVSQIPGCH